MNKLGQLHELTKALLHSHKSPILNSFAGAAMLMAYPSMNRVSDWFNTDWKKRKKITIDSTKVDATLTDFPILLSVDDSDLGSAQADGDDFVITNSDGTTQIPHEIEKWDGTSILVLWFKGDLDSSTDTEFYIYWENSSAANQEDPTNVWDANFKGVYHLHDDFLDSTSNNNDLTNTGSTDAVAKIADGQNYDGVDDESKIDVAVVGSHPVTFSAWMKMDQLASVADQNFWFHNEADKDVGNIYHGLLVDKVDDKAVIANRNGNGTVSARSVNALSASTWYYVVGVIDSADDLHLYLDGNLENSTTSSTSISNIDRLGIGAWAPTDKFGNFFDGIMDEARISNAVRSASWILTEYNNQNSPGTFHTLGALESI